MAARRRIGADATHILPWNGLKCCNGRVSSPEQIVTKLRQIEVLLGERKRPDIA